MAAAESPDCSFCKKFYGSHRTCGYCSACYVAITGDHSHITPSILGKRRERANYVVHFAANYKDEVRNPLNFALWAKKFLAPKLKANKVTLDTLRVLLIDWQTMKHVFILSDSAHFLITFLAKAKCPIATHHLTQHLVFSHVLDTWNIDPKISSVGACYYQNYGIVPKSTFGDIKKHTLSNIEKAVRTLKRETEPTYCCMGAFKAKGLEAATGATPSETATNAAVLKLLECVDKPKTSE